MCGLSNERGFDPLRCDCVRIVTVEAVAAQQRQQQAVADFEAGRVTAAQAAASAEAPATGPASQDPQGSHPTDTSVPMAVASSCRRACDKTNVATCLSVNNRTTRTAAHGGGQLSSTLTGYALPGQH